MGMNTAMSNYFNPGETVVAVEVDSDNDSLILGMIYTVRMRDVTSKEDSVGNPSPDHFVYLEGVTGGWYAYRFRRIENVNGTVFIPHEGGSFPQRKGRVKLKDFVENIEQHKSRRRGRMLRMGLGKEASSGN